MIKAILFILFFPAIVLFYSVLLSPIAIAISYIPTWLLTYILLAGAGYLGFLVTYKEQQ